MATIVPASPNSASRIFVRFSGAGCGAQGHVDVVGSTVVATETISCLCFATAPGYRFDVPVGQLAAGEYTLLWRFGYFDPQLPFCSHSIEREQFTAFSVSEAAAPTQIPVDGSSALTLLAMLVLLAGVEALHKYVRRRIQA